MGNGDPEDLVEWPKEQMGLSRLGKLFQDIGVIVLGVLAMIVGIIIMLNI